MTLTDQGEALFRKKKENRKIKKKLSNRHQSSSELLLFSRRSVIILIGQISSDIYANGHQGGESHLRAIT